MKLWMAAPCEKVQHTYLPVLLHQQEKEISEGSAPLCDTGNWWGGKGEMTLFYEMQNYT